MGIKFTGFGGSTGKGCGCPCTGGTCNVTICADFCHCPITTTFTITGVGTQTVTNPAGNPCATFNVGTAGTYTITIAASGYPTVTVTQALACNNTYHFGMNTCPSGLSISANTTTYGVLSGTLDSSCAIQFTGINAQCPGGDLGYSLTCSFGNYRLTVNDCLGDCTNRFPTSVQCSPFMVVFTFNCSVAAGGASTVTIS